MTGEIGKKKTRSRRKIYEEKGRKREQEKKKEPTCTRAYSQKALSSDTEDTRFGGVTCSGRHYKIDNTTFLMFGDELPC
uniref:Uncharacterized protein n=1 Tax=Anguilla anguilla TaxID=7936 RepID=A0A0E9WWZ5_ANGAN